MYQITSPQESASGYLEMASDNQTVLIDPCNGARVHSWMSQGVSIITNVEPLPYESTYAGAILFPFANRIKEGIYRFRESEFQLNINEQSNNCALHGLVYNKSFEIAQCNTTNGLAKVTLTYAPKFPEQGFPFQYRITATYTIDSNGLSLSISIKNTDTKAFPFTVGWHPYFKSESIQDSQLIFHSSTQIETDDQMITTSVKTHYKKAELSLGSRDFDDCYGLQRDPILLETPLYRLTLSSSDAYKYLQFYTPPVDNTIAIEPVTGISNSFNNSHGLQVLDAGEDYEITWQLNLNHQST